MEQIVSEDYLYCQPIWLAYQWASMQLKYRIYLLLQLVLLVGALYIEWILQKCFYKYTIKVLYKFNKVKN